MYNVKVLCEICRIRLPTPKRLISHYLRGHSKFRLARQLFKLSIRNTVPKVYAKTRIRKTKNGSEADILKPAPKTETVFANDKVQILYRDNEIIIRDDKSSVDMEFSFDEDSVEAEEKSLELTKAVNPKRYSKKTVGVTNNIKSNKTSELKRLLKFKNEEDISRSLLSTSSSSVSSEDSSKKFSFKKRIRKRRGTRGKTSHYKINITRTNNSLSLNENTGNFYQCNCSHDSIKNVALSTAVKLASDTESASDTGRSSSFHDPKVFCSKCGNGYRDERSLMEHIKIHETHCRVCNEIFPTEQQFKQHVESHIFKVFVCPMCNYEFLAKPMLQIHFEEHREDSILESVIDMEEDYNFTPFSPLNISYESSIDGIITYLMQSNDFSYSESHCDICHF